MTFPLSNKPKITQRNIVDGYIIRYFITHISIPRVIEVDKTQYDIFKTDPLYRTLELKWVIDGFANNTITTNGKTIFGVKHQNETTTKYFDKQMPGLIRVLSNPLEFFIGRINKP